MLTEHGYVLHSDTDWSSETDIDTRGNGSTATCTFVCPPHPLGLLHKGLQESLFCINDRGSCKSESRMEGNKMERGKHQQLSRRESEIRGGEEGQMGVNKRHRK